MVFQIHQLTQQFEINLQKFVIPIYYINKSMHELTRKF